MTQEEYIKTHPEQFKDDIDKWLFSEFGIIGGCCSAEKSHEYHIARMVTEKLTDTFIEKAAVWIKNKAERYVVETSLWPYFDYKRAVEDFVNYMKGE